MFLENPYLLLLGVLCFPLLYRGFRNPERKWKIVNISYAIVILLLAVAAASPAIQQSTEQVERKELIYLDDTSRSMVEPGPNISIQGVSVRKENLVSGNDSRIDTALTSYVEPNRSYLVRSDFRTEGDLEQVQREFNRRNATLHVLDTELPEENSVSISGPSITVPGADNRYSIPVSSTTDGEHQVTVEVDGEQVASEMVEDELVINHEFQEDGYHRITAEIESEDEYQENNRFYKSIKVVEKPELLVIGDSGELDNQMSEFFEITRRDTVPEDLSDYYSVILKKKIDDTSDLKPYLIEGNGLVYTGDGTMDILPVERSKAQQNTENPSILTAVDISMEGECVEWLDPDDRVICVERSNTAEDIHTSRSFAFNLINNLERDYPGTRMGVLLYNEDYYSLGQPEPVTANSERLKQRMNELRLSGVGFHQLGISKSQEMLGEEGGNILLVTDGEPPSSGGLVNPNYRSSKYQSVDIDDSMYESELVRFAEDLPDNVKLFTIAVGEDKNLDFLRQLSRRGGGVSYDDVDEFYNNPPTFMGGGGFENSEILTIVDSNHFITKDLGRLRTSVYQFDQVKPKPSSNLLVTSSDGRPALTTWRYGLGRVASFSAGDRDLSSILSQEPQLVARSVSWASGNPQRKVNGTVGIDSGRIGEQVTVSADYPLEGLSRKSENRYSKQLQPDSTGFHSYQGHEFDYNYNEEVEELGYDREAMNSLSSATDGEVVSPEEVVSLGSTVPTVREEITESRSLSNFFILAALVLFLVQVGFRKFNGLI